MFYKHNMFKYTFRNSYFLCNIRRWNSSEVPVRHSKRIKTKQERREHFKEHCRKVEGETILNTTATTGNITQEPRLPKKKVALHLGFNGTGYQGMQW